MSLKLLSFIGRFCCVTVICTCCTGGSVNSERIQQFENYFELGVQSEKAGDYDLAVSYFEAAVKFSERENLANKGDAYNYIGQIALQQGKYDVAMEYFPRALNIRIQLNDKEGQATSYLNIGTMYQKEGWYEQAQEQYERSLNLYQSLKHEAGKANCFNNLGGLWFEQNKPEQALKYYFKSEEIYLANGNYDRLCTVYDNIGSIYHSMNETKEAQKYYFKMLQLSRSLTSPEILAETYFSIGAYHSGIDEPDSAIFYYGKAIEIAESSNLFEILYYVLEERSNLYAREERYGKAYNDHVAYSFAYDIVNNKEKIQTFTQKSMQYEFDIQQQQQQYQNRNQRIFIIALSIVVILVIAVVVILNRSIKQKKKSNELLASQNDLLERQKEAITDSIRYASLIQKSTLPTKEYSDYVLSEHFIYYKPRDIVSGDFYWIDYTEDRTIIAVADCTGHGVPGAIVSMLGISALNKITSRMKEPKADEILNELRNEIIHQLNPVGSANIRRDGMDIALVVIPAQTHEMEYAGAYNPLFIVRDGQLIEKKADKMPIGLYVNQNKSFTAHRFDYLPGDTLYLFSDGYVDQFGGTDGSKFKMKNFKDLLIKINSYPLEEQARILDQTHLEWKGTYDQVDDILVIGIKLS